MKYIFGVIAIGIFALFLFIGIAASQVGEGWRYAAQVEANDRAAENAQRRQMERDAFDAKLPAIIAEAAEDAQFYQMLQHLWQSLTVILPIAAVAILLPVGFTTGIMLSILIIGLGVILLKRQRLRAALIPLDQKTGQYPLLTTTTPDGLFCLVNPNDDSVMIVDGNRRLPFPQKVTASAYTQALGIAGYHAERMRQPDAMRMINPPLIAENSNSPETE